jgi:hypothetical protein
MPEVFELTTAAGPARAIHPREQRALCVQLFDHALDDPVGLGKPGHAVVERRGGDECPAVGQEERIGLEARGRA